LVNFEGHISTAGTTSFQIIIDAYAEGSQNKKRLACTAIITMVAVKKEDDGTYSKCPHGRTL